MSWKGLFGPAARQAGVSKHGRDGKPTPGEGGGEGASGAAFASDKRLAVDGFNGAADNLDNGMGDRAARRLGEVSTRLRSLAAAAQASGDAGTAQSARAIADEAQALSAQLRGARPKELDVAGDHVFDLRTRTSALKLTAKPKA